MYDLLRERFHLDGTGRLLDLGCGAGTIALQLRDDFEEVIGMDPEPELIREAASIATNAGATNVRWIEGGSADLAEMRDDLGSFRLVTIGNAFHWMDRVATLEFLYNIVEPGGGVAVLGGETISLEPAGTERAIQDVMRKWLGEARRAGSGTYAPPKERHEAVIAGSSFRGMEPHAIDAELHRTSDEIIGGLYSTSFCSPYVLGAKQAPFERDLRAALHSLSPRGTFVHRERFGALLAWKS